MAGRSVNQPFSFTSAGATTVGSVDAVGGVSAGSGNVTLTAGGALTVTRAVSGGGVTLTGAGVTLGNAAITAPAATVVGTGAAPTLTAGYAGGATVTIAGQNTGTVKHALLSVPVSYRGFANLAGASGQEAFVFSPAGSITGSLNAAGGTLDYTAIPGAAFQVTGSGPQGVSGTAPLIGGTFTNVRSFLGGAGSSLALTGTVTNNSDLMLGGQLDTVIDGVVTGAGRVLNVGHMLGGTGVIQQTLIVQGGTLRPGHGGVGKLTVRDLVLTPQATFQADLVPATPAGRAAAQTLSNLLSATGTAKLGNAKLGVMAHGQLASTDMADVLTAGSFNGLTGTFGGLPDGADVPGDGQLLAVNYLRGGPSQAVRLSPKGTPAQLVVAGPGSDGQAHVRVLGFDGGAIPGVNGQPDDFVPFPGYQGPVNVALGDVNRDGVKDVVVAAGAGNPDVRVYDGAAFKLGTFDPANPGASVIAQWFPYALQFNVGAYVAVGDVDGDGYGDVVTGASAGNPDVRVYSGQDIARHAFDPNGHSLLAQWFAYGLQFNVGATVAVGDVEQNGFADVVTGANVGNPHVKVYSGQAIAQHTLSPANPDASLVTQFFPYALQFNVGANVAVGDVNGDGFADLITGASAGNPDVRVYSGKDIATHRFNPDNLDASQLAEFFAFGAQTNGGVTVGVTDFNHSGKPAIVTGAASAPVYRVVPAISSGYLPPALLEDAVQDIDGGVAVGA